MEEKKRLLMEQKKADRLYELKACEMDQRATELAIEEEATRRALNEALRDYNLALVRGKGGGEGLDGRGVGKGK